VQGKKQYSYEDAGYNGFYRRSLASDPSERVLSARTNSGRQVLDFDQLQVGGRLGDTLQVGNLLYLDGKEGRFEVRNEQGDVIGYLGNRIV
jgi:hypothetical protein